MNSEQMTSIQIDQNHLLRLRLVVARVGELGLAGWWGSNAVLGAMGAMAYQRGFPRSHRWARARVVFELARVRCQERFPDSDSITLWHLPAAVEEQFEHTWSQWIGDEEAWPAFFDRLQNWDSPDLIQALKSFGLWSWELDAGIGKVTPSGASIQLPSTIRLSDQDLSLLAGGFSKGSVGTLVVPFLRLTAA